MRSPLELLNGRFEHALLTTYSFNLRFFEEWVLHALWAAEVRNVVVFVDRHELGHALTDRAPSAAGRAYHVVAASNAQAAFHPKLLLVTGRDGARACISSANLTPDGQLRNAESAIAFDSHLRGHSLPIRDVGEVFRRLSAGAPVHTAAAIQKALAALPEEEPEPSPYRVVHNLDDPLIAAFPDAGAIRAVAPFVDADGSAASELHARGELTVVVDGEQIAASRAFFAGPWQVDARRFDARLHGKAYEVMSATDRWVLVGSPNLSVPALLRKASAGNLEVAVAVGGADALKLPESQPYELATLAEAAEARLQAARVESSERRETGRAFDAWEDEQRIIVAGVPDGSRVEHWEAERWHPLGTVQAGAVLLSDPELRPSRIRAVLDNGGVAFAVVARPARLLARMRASTSGRQTQAAGHLPLDVDTVRVLEEALSQLYTLAEITGEERTRPLLQSAPRGPRVAPEQELLEWMPRHADDEPHIPALYTSALGPSPRQG